MKLFKPLALASTAATFVLVSIGGLVRATKSGLGCGTDWPHCSGKLLPSLEQRAQMIEFSHRSAAAIVVVLLAALAVVALRYHRHDRRLLWTSLIAFALVLFQAVLGAIVVKLELDAVSVVLHLATALTLLALLVYLSVSLVVPSEAPRDQGIGKTAALVAGSVFVLLLVGSYVSGAKAGFAFPDWPLMDGKLVPNLAVDAKAIHFFHRALAGVVAVIVGGATWRIVTRGKSVPLAVRFASIGAGLFALEIAIGALNVWTRLNAAAVTAHLAIGAAIWSSWVAAALVARPVTERARSTVPSRKVAEARS